MKIFQNWSFNELKTLYEESIRFGYLKRQIVYKEKEAPKYFYIIKQGEFSVTAKILIPLKNKKNEVLNFPLIN